jgi:predicted permease
MAMGMGLLGAKIMRLSAPETATFTQCSFHGNVGYVGLAVAYYFLGNEDFAQTSILAGFLILIQNFLAVETLTAFQKHKPGRKWSNLIRPIALHPVILATLAGMLVSLSGLRLPEILERWLTIVKGMGLPLALLLIGASLSPTLMKRGLRLALSSGCIKLILEPAAGLGLALLLGLTMDQYLPGFVTIATPTATATYVMAVGMSGDPDQASAAISINTLLSGVTYTLWLGLLT